MDIENKELEQKVEILKDPKNFDSCECIMAWMVYLFLDISVEKMDQVI